MILKYSIFADFPQPGKFLPPYYLLLNRPNPRSSSLRVHKHTIPACIGLGPLLLRYLPQPTSRVTAKSSKHLPRQDLPGLVRALRREVTAHHLRHTYLDWTRQSLLGESGHGTMTDGQYDISKVTIGDTEARELQIQLEDGTEAKLQIGTHGKAHKCVAYGTEGRDGALERIVQGGDGRIEGLAERLLRPG